LTVTVRKGDKQQVMARVVSAERRGGGSLAGSRDTVLDSERRRLAIDVTDIDQLSHHVAFDTARLLPRAATIRALQDQLSWLLPLSGAVEDRIAEYIAPEGRLQADVAGLVARVEQWFAQTISG